MRLWRHIPVVTRILNRGLARSFDFYFDTTKDALFTRNFSMTVGLALFVVGCMSVTHDRRVIQRWYPICHMAWKLQWWILIILKVHFIATRYELPVRVYCTVQCTFASILVSVRVLNLIRVVMNIVCTADSLFRVRCCFRDSTKSAISQSVCLHIAASGVSRR